jgi:hypothetical protein
MLLLSPVQFLKSGMQPGKMAFLLPAGIFKRKENLPKDEDRSHFFPEPFDTPDGHLVFSPGNPAGKTCHMQILSFHQYLL